MHAGPITYTYKTVADCEIKADVYRSSESGGGAPAILYIHGGCLMYGSRSGINPEQLNLYRDAGFTVIAIDYRLAPESKVPAIIEDLVDAFSWVGATGPDLFGIDPQRIAVVGHSAGGYLALMSGCCVKPRPKGIIAFYGYGDIIADWYTKPDPFYCSKPAVSEEESGRLIEGPVISEPYEGRGKDLLYLYCRQNGLWPFEVGGEDPDENPAFFGPYCPQRNVDADYPPTLLLHGDKDTDVPYQQSVLMAAELARQNIEHELITMPGHAHGFDGQMQAPAVKGAFDKVLTFLGKCLQEY